MTSNSTLLTGSKRVLEEDNLLPTTVPDLKKHKSSSEEEDDNSENLKRTVTKRTGNSIYLDIEGDSPRLFISTQDSLKRILKLIALTTGTSYFKKVTNDLHDFNIDSIVYIIHDPSVDKDNMIVTRQRFCGDDSQDEPYEITTVKNKVSDMLQELVEQRDGFDIIDKFSSDENRLLVIKANFDKWDIYFNHIVIACHATEDSIASLTWDVNFTTDKYITVLRSDSDIEYFSTNMEKNLDIESHKSFTERVLVLVPEEYDPEWINEKDAFYELFSIEKYRLHSHGFKRFNEPEMIRTVHKFTKSDIVNFYDDDDEN